jgi:serine/threonine protein kinase
LKGLGLPIPDIDPQPIVDGGRIHGYRMGLLAKLERCELRSREQDILCALSELHAAGFCHGDIVPGNIMKGRNDQIILIDFSFAGRIGSTVPPLIPDWVYAGGIFAAEDDLEAFHEFIAG